jgi:hypothetical protein
MAPADIICISITTGNTRCKHVTVNADQALVAEQVLTGKCDDTALLTAITERPIQMVAESIEPEAAGVGRKKE